MFIRQDFVLWKLIDFLRTDAKVSNILNNKVPMHIGKLFVLHYFIHRRLTVCFVYGIESLRIA